MSTHETAQDRLEERLRRAAQSARKDKAGIGRASGPGPWPLSYSQHRLWLQQQLDPGSGFYNVSRILRLEGPLDVDALDRSLSEIVRRHAVLRTTIECPHGTPMQAVRSFQHRPLDIADPAGEQRIRQWILDIASHPFRLDSDWPFRYRLFRSTPQTHDLALVFHHVAVDGWSVGILLRELGTLYSAFSTGDAPRLPGPALSYVDFTLWQRELVESHRIDSQLDFWRRHWQGVPEVLALPLDRVRPARASHIGAREHASLSADSVLRFRALMRSRRTTVFAGLLSALQVLLSRHASQDDFAIGTPVAGRTTPELETIVGCFANTLFLRSSLEGDPSFDDLLHRVAAVVNQGIANQEIPLEILSERLRDRHAVRPPRLQILFVLQHPGDRDVHLAGLDCSVDRAERYTSRCDLTFFAADQGSEIVLEIEYDTDLFDRSSIRRLLSHYTTLVESLVDSPDAPVSRAGMLPADEGDLLAGFSPPKQPYPTDPVHTIFERQSASAPDAVAIVDGARRLTYGDLDTAANRVANYLLSRNLKAGALVAVGLTRSADLLAAFLGIWKAGAAWVPLNPGDPPARNRKIVEDSGAEVVLLEIEDALRHPDASRPSALITPNGLAYVMYTSGSTGEPKGVEIPHRAIVRLVMQNAYVSFGPDQTFLAAAPATFDASIFEFWGALLHGSKCVLFPDRIPEARELAHLIQQEQITTAWLASSLFNALVDEQADCLAGVQQLIVGGEALSVAHVRRAMAALPSTRIVNGYGPTENTTFTCCWTIPAVLPERLVSIPIGPPIANTSVYVLDKHQSPCGINVPGEIFIGGDGLALGYRNHPELTAESFITAPWGERLYRSGDLGRWLENGAIDFLGRADSQLKLRGFRIEPAEIEAALAEHPDVEDAFVLPMNRGGVTRLVAYVQSRGGAGIIEPELRAHLSGRLPDFLRPASYCFVANIPRGANGKRDAASLPDPSLTATEPKPACDIVEEQLMEIVQRLLPGDRFGADTNLFDAGLHSLLLARLRGHIDRSFGHTLELSAMYANPTIRAIAKLIREDSGEKQPGAPDPFFFVHAGETLRELVARLGDRPLHGIGFSAPDPQPRSIEEHAGHEVAALLRIHPRGQFLIGGWSASGVLAVEIARRLKELGRDVALVVLFDAPNYAHFLRQTPGTRAAEFFRGHYLRLRYHAGVLRHRPVTEWMQYLQDRLRSLRRSLRLEVVRMQNRHGKAGPKSRYDSDLFVAIATDFVPAQYHGRVLLVRRTERASEWGASWDLGWKDVVTGGLEIQTVPGNHMTMFHEPQVDTLAALLRERFDAVTNHLSG